MSGISVHDVDFSYTGKKPWSTKLVYVYDLIWFYMILYTFIWFYMIFYGFIWFYMILYDFNWFYILLYNFIWFYMILCNFIRFYIILYDFIWFYMILYDFLPKGWLSKGCWTKIRAKNTVMRCRITYSTHGGDDIKTSYNNHIKITWRWYNNHLNNILNMT